MTTRKYDNLKREQKASETRERIKDALIQQMISNNSTDLSVEQAAEDAGVSVRTIFRHFATKEDMLAAVSEGVTDVTKNVDKPQSPMDLIKTLNQTFHMFEENQNLITATLLSEVGRGVRSELAVKRRTNNMVALEPLVKRFPKKEAKTIQAVLCSLITAEVWWNLKHQFSVDGQDAVVVIEWMLKNAIDALAKGDGPFSVESKSN